MAIKSKKGRIITGILAGISGLAAIFFSAKMISNVVSPNNESPDVVQRLDTVKNVSYDENNYTLSWSNVEHADGYRVSVNGNVVECGEAQYHYVPTSKETIFKVQATDSTNTYVASNWSTECSYTIPDNQNSYAAVNSFVSGMINGINVTKVVSMHAEGNSLFTTAVFYDDMVYQFEHTYDSPVTSLSDIVTNSNYGNNHYILNDYDAKNYDSASYYLRSSVYERHLEEYRQQGYTFDVVSSQSYKIGSGAMGMDCVLKLTNGSDVKYVSTSLMFYVNDTANESIKYTSALVNIDPNMVRSHYCVELSGDFVDYAKDLEKANSSAPTVQSVYTYDAGMSY